MNFCSVHEKVDDTVCIMDPLDNETDPWWYWILEDYHNVQYHERCPTYNEANDGDNDGTVHSCRKCCRLGAFRDSFFPCQSGPNNDIGARNYH